MKILTLDIQTYSKLLGWSAGLDREDQRTGFTNKYQPKSWKNPGRKHKLCLSSQHGLAKKLKRSNLGFRLQLPPAEPGVHLLKIDSVIESTIHCRASDQAPNKPRGFEESKTCDVSWKKHIPLHWSCSWTCKLCKMCNYTVYTCYIPQCLSLYTHTSFHLLGLCFVADGLGPKKCILETPILRFRSLGGMSSLRGEKAQICH